LIGEITTQATTKPSYQKITILMQIGIKTMVSISLSLTREHLSVRQLTIYDED